VLTDGARVWVRTFRTSFVLVLCATSGSVSKKVTARQAPSRMYAWDRRQSDHRHPHPDNFVFLGSSSFFCDAPRPQLLASVVSQVL
jgi:hypothetical protein